MGLLQSRACGGNEVESSMGCGPSPEVISTMLDMRLRMAMESGLGLVSCSSDLMII